jgi:hypothetical protein
MLSFNVAANKRLLASLLAHTGRLESALVLMNEAEPDLRPAMPLEHATEVQLAEYASFLLDYAELLELKQDRAGAVRVLEELSEILAEGQRRGVMSHEQQRHIARLRFLQWALHGEELADNHPVLLDLKGEPGGQYRSCDDVEVRAMLSVIDGELAEAQREADYLAGRGYRNPGYVTFCRRHGLCPP